MRGWQLLTETLIAQGVAHLFGNPWTTESPIRDQMMTSVGDLLR